MMKMRILVLTLVVAIFAIGCGNEEQKLSQQTEDIDTTIESEMNSEINQDMFLSGEELDNYMASIIEQSDSIKNSLEYEELTQTDMDAKSQELYELWDNALNFLWAGLKSSLSEEEFSKLLDSQRIWVEEKEASVEEAGIDYMGGSMYSLVVNMEAAKITEERVLELYELLK